MRKNFLKMLFPYYLSLPLFYITLTPKFGISFAYKAFPPVRRREEIISGRENIKRLRLFYSNELNEESFWHHDKKQSYSLQINNWLQVYIVLLEVSLINSSSANNIILLISNIHYRIDMSLKILAIFFVFSFIRLKNY